MYNKMRLRKLSVTDTDTQTPTSTSRTTGNDNRAEFGIWVLSRTQKKKSLPYAVHTINLFAAARVAVAVVVGFDGFGGSFYCELRLQCRCRCHYHCH